MVTQERAIGVAEKLFPDDKADGSDCRNFFDNPGAPCPVCAERNEQWIKKVREVRAAMLEAFR